jgi:hypothetical protein
MPHNFGEEEYNERTCCCMSGLVWLLPVERQVRRVSSVRPSVRPSDRPSASVGLFVRWPLFGHEHAYSQRGHTGEWLATGRRRARRSAQGRQVKIKDTNSNLPEQGSCFGFPEYEKHLSQKYISLSVDPVHGSKRCIWLL